MQANSLAYNLHIELASISSYCLSNGRENLPSSLNGCYGWNERLAGWELFEKYLRILYYAVWYVRLILDME